MNFKRGDVVTAAFQGDLGKPRPPVVLHADEFIEHHVTLLLCPLTTFMADSPAFRPTLDPSSDNGLETTSQIMVDKMTHLRKTAIRQIIGHLNDDEVQLLETALINITGLRQSVLPIAKLKR